MTEFNDVFDKFPLQDLESREICAFCIVSGVFLEDSLHSIFEMQGGPISSDMKCEHCYDTEEEFGRFQCTQEEFNEAFKVQKDFREYKEQRLKKEYS
jgi:hypothetical protein